MDHPMPLPTGGRRFPILVSAFAALCAAAVFVPLAHAQDDAQPSGDYGPYSGGRTGADDSYHPPQNVAPAPAPAPAGNGSGAVNDPPYRPGGAYREDDNYRRYEDRSAAAPRDEAAPGYGEPYRPPGEGPGYDGPPPRDDGYSQNEIIEAGGRFFGSVSKGLASVVEYAFQKSGRPNGYILGTDGGGAFIAGLRYGEGTLYTRDAGAHRVFWQGPSIGYDFGGEGSKTMVLVYNLRDPSQIYERYAGVQGSAYLVGGVGIQFQTHGNVTLAPIRSGIGLRLGANVGYLKYTRSPTWNPF
jgi:hypothetical protein